MDMWLVSTLAAAGYLSKYWQNITKQEVTSSKRSYVDSQFVNLELSNQYLDMNCLDVASITDLVSENGFLNEKLQALDNTLYLNALSLSNLKADDREESPTGPVLDNYQQWLPCPSTRGMSSFHSRGTKIGSLKTKIPHGQFIVPQNSFESCLMAHFYQKNEMEKYVSCSTASEVSVNEEFQFGRQIRDKHVHGVPQLPKIWSFETPKKRNLTRGCRQDGNKNGYGKMVHPKRALYEAGSLGGSVLFFFGISVGIISSLLSNKREVDQLKEVLKQTVDLVQDLQEELEMKNSLTVHELINKNCESTDTCGNSFPEMTPDAFSAKLNRESYDRKADESSDSMSKIEAELEAELERLGMGLATNAYNNEPRVSDLIEPEFYGDYAPGELIADSEQSFACAKPNRDTKYSTTYSGNFQVSPWDLSLRLHEVIQSRLELRVNELETALQNSQKKVFMRSQSETLWRASSNGSKSPNLSEEIPIRTKKIDLAIKCLSGEALDAYNEAYKELTKTEISDEEEQTSSDFRTYNAQNPNEFLRFQSDGKDDGDEEMERELIQKIVEKTRKGSPVVLHAQRWLFSLDEEEI